LKTLINVVLIDTRKNGVCWSLQEFLEPQLNSSILADTDRKYSTWNLPQKDDCLLDYRCFFHHQIPDRLWNVDQVTFQSFTTRVWFVTACWVALGFWFTSVAVTPSLILPTWKPAHYLCIEMPRLPPRHYSTVDLRGYPAAGLIYSLGFNWRAFSKTT
jgi:hypothetical protein